MKTLLGSSLILLISLLFTRDLDPATLNYSIGDVKVKRGAALLNGTPGMELAGGDIITTGRKSLAIIAFSRGSMVRMREESRLSISGTDRKDDESISLFLSEGSVFSRAVKRLGAEKFEINTATVVAAVRGTEFFFAFGKEGASGKDLWLCVNEGLVQVADRSNTVRQASLKKGEGIFIRGGSVFTDPKRYPWTRDLNWNMDPARGPVVDTTDLKAAYTDLLNQDYD